jgi:hypothetical protein
LQQPYYQTVAYNDQPSYTQFGANPQPSYNQFGNASSFPLQTSHTQVSLPENLSRVAIPSPPQINSTPPSMKDQLADILREYGLAPKGTTRAYQKPYPESFDSIPYPRGVRIPDFVKFTGEDGRSTLEHVGQFLMQTSEFGTSDVYRIKLFPISLSGVAFTWFLSLPPNSITTWSQLEQKFHEYFYSGETELRLSDLTMVRQKYNESVHDYIRRFRDTKNRCFSLTIAEKDLADLAFSGLLTHIKDKLEGQEFLDVNQVLQKSLAQQNRVRDVKQATRFRDNRGKEKVTPTVNIVEYDSDSASDDDMEICVAEWIQTPKSKPFVCPALKPTPTRK